MKGFYSLYRYDQYFLTFPILPRLSVTWDQGVFAYLPEH